MRVLVTTPEPIGADDLRAALGPDALEDTEVLVVSPVFTSPLRFWVSDVDDAIARAERVQRTSVERLEAAGIDAVGDTGEPETAIEDALATFDADRIVIFQHERARQRYREDELTDERFDRPVEIRRIGGDGT